MNRRELITGAGLVGAFAPFLSLAQETMQRRAIPGTDESLPVVGLGNAEVFAQGDLERTSELLGILVDHGGAYVDCSGRTINTVGTVAKDEGISDQLFMGTYIQRAEDAGDRSAARAFMEVQGKEQLDLVVTRNIDDYIRRADSFRGLKEEGLTRYIGVARHMKAYHERMMQLMQAGAVDFVQVNYSILEPEAEERLLPMAQDLGVAILTNRAFLNGRYFSVVSGKTLPEWAREFDCDTWAKFSLKYILSHPAVNCTLTETSNPRHALDNLGAGFGRLPDAAMRKRMRETLLAMV